MQPVDQDDTRTGYRNERLWELHPRDCVGALLVHCPTQELFPPTLVSTHTGALPVSLDSSHAGAEHQRLSDEAAFAQRLCHGCSILQQVNAAQVNKKIVEWVLSKTPYFRYSCSFELQAWECGRWS